VVRWSGRLWSFGCFSVYGVGCDAVQGLRARLLEVGLGVLVPVL
jgi:hypothetical protein